MTDEKNFVPGDWWWVKLGDGSEVVAEVNATKAPPPLNAEDIEWSVDGELGLSQVTPVSRCQPPSEGDAVKEALELLSRLKRARALPVFDDERALSWVDADDLHEILDGVQLMRGKRSSPSEEGIRDFISCALDVHRGTKDPQGLDRTVRTPSGDARLIVTLNSGDQFVVSVERLLP